MASIGIGFGIENFIEPGIGIGIDFRSIKSIGIGIDLGPVSDIGIGLTKLVLSVSALHTAIIFLFCNCQKFPFQRFFSRAAISICNCKVSTSSPNKVSHQKLKSTTQSTHISPPSYVLVISF